MVFFLTSHTTCQHLNGACQLMCILFSCKNLRVKCQKRAKTLSNIYIEGKATRLQTSLPNERGTKLLEGRNMSRPIVFFLINSETDVFERVGPPLESRHGEAGGR
jgi:hypothetical protein